MRKHVLPLLAVAVGSAALVLVLTQQGELASLRAELAEARAAPAPAPREAAPPPADDGLARRRIAGLEARIEALERRPAARPTARPSHAAPAAGKVADEIASLREDVDALLTGEGLEGRAAEGRIAAVMQRERDRRWKKRMEIRARSEEEWLGRFAAEARLDGAQLEQMRQLAQTRREGEARIWRPVREGDKSFLAAKTEDLLFKAGLKQRLGEILDESQLETFWAAVKRDTGARGRNL